MYNTLSMGPEGVMSLCLCGVDQNRGRLHGRGGFQNTANNGFKTGIYLRFSDRGIEDVNILCLMHSGHSIFRVSQIQYMHEILKLYRRAPELPLCFNCINIIPKLCRVNLCTGQIVILSLAVWLAKRLN